MKQILLIGSTDRAGKNDVNEMARSLKPRLSEAVVSTACLEDLLFEIGTGRQSVIDAKTGHDIAEADLVLAFNWYKNGSKSIYRDLAYALALYLDSRGVAVWNQEAARQRSTTKLSAMMRLSLLGLPIPDTRFSLSAERLLSGAEHDIFVCKSVSASRGADNFLFESIDEARLKLTGQTINRFMIQKFVPNTADWRVICFGGEPKLVIERSRLSAGTHLNNTSKGASATLKKPEELPAKIIEECKDICYSMGREMAGIDILPSSREAGEYFYLEVNAVPQLTSGSFVDDKMTALAETLNTIRIGNENRNSG